MSQFHAVLVLLLNLQNKCNNIPYFHKMYFKASLTFVIVLIICELPKGKSEHPKFEECKKLSEKYFKKSHKNAMDCHANLKDDKLSLQEQFDKFGCTVKCILKKDNLLDENETLSDDFMKSIHTGRVIPEFDNKLLSHFMECKTKFGGKLDKSEADCKSYREYGLCMQESISHVCYENP